MLSSKNQKENTPTYQEIVLEEILSLSNPKFKIPEGLFIPLGNRALIREEIQGEQKTEGGIILQGGPTKFCKIGVVYRVGDKMEHPILPGHKVAFDKDFLSAVTYKGVNYYDVPGGQIYSIVPPENYLAIRVPTNKDKRRIYLAECDTKARKKSNDKIDAINTGEKV